MCYLRQAYCWLNDSSDSQRYNCRHRVISRATTTTPKNIRLELRFDWEQEQAFGTETITLSPLVTDLRRVDLDAAHMTFNSVKLASGVALKFENDVPKEKLFVTLDNCRI